MPEIFHLQIDQGFSGVTSLQHRGREIVNILSNDRIQACYSSSFCLCRPIVSSPGQMLKLQECLEPGRTALSEKMGTITTKSCTVANKVHFPSYIVTDESKTQNDTLWCTEIER